MIDQLESLISKLLSNQTENLKPPDCKKQKIVDTKNSLTSLEIVVGIYRLLKFDFKKYVQKWKIDQIVKYLDTNLPDTIQDFKIKHKSQDQPLVKWFILETLCLLLPIQPVHKENIFKQYFTSDQIEDLQQRFQLIVIDNDLNYLNLKISEISNDYQDTKDLIKTNFDHNVLEAHKRFSSFTTKDLAVNIAKKTQKLYLKESNLKTNELVLVNTTKKNIERLELAIQSGDCIIVEGVLSSGKTSIINHLADKYNIKLIKYQIDDNMDDKALIGNYICSHIPGEFVWKPGPLYQAVSDDCWIVLEDFDHSPIDSLSLLIDLLETNCLKTSNNVSLNIKSNFRLFLTSRTGLQSLSNLNFIDSIKKLGRIVDLKELEQSEIIEIIIKKFPKFKTNTKSKIVENILDMLNFFAQAECIKHKKLGQRTLSLRDLFKLFERLNSLNNTEDRKMHLSILNDAYDVFIASIQDKLIRNDLCIHLATRFNINKDEALSLIINNKPNFEKKSEEIICGRVKLSIKKINSNLINTSSLILDMNSDRFVYTKSALKLIEQIARCIECNEPVLLSGETGVGKTSSLQHLAKLLGKQCSVINLSQQTETSDLLGSFKPVDIKSQMKFLKENFIQLFSDCFNINENRTFLTHISNTYCNSNWKTLMQLLLHATSLAYKKFKKENKPVWSKWKEFEKCLLNYNESLDQLINKFSFQFFEGALTKAILNGEWIILDEINLASPETLQFLNPLLENNNSQDSSIVLYEKGSNESLIRHRDFRLFGAMNPASDIGKRNLPDSIRNRFTEIFVNELDCEEDLIVLIREYLHSLTNVTIDLVRSIVEFYMSLKNDAFLKKLSNGTGAKPTYSLRTLCRGLKYASLNLCNNSLLSVYDGLCLSFLTDLDRESSLFLEEHIKEILFKSSKSKILVKINRKQPKRENTHLDYINIEDYWIIKGLSELKQSDNSYIFTKSIRENLRRLVRVCSAQLPCLIQGDTSIGKTSLIKWLANATGNTLIRINNHDHTDLQEYVGSYVIEPNGNLTFKEGLLATAMRNGYWILLDELNLASSEVLEALNRVLDDNRELYIPETQEVIKAHPRFVLFATQNPPGKYAGRKQLSRAFRNRFIELHFEEVPEDELLEIVEKKCQLPNSYAKLLIKTVVELKTKRSQMGGIFLGKHSLITLRDLFRWAKRYSTAVQLNEDCCDWKQYLAEQGLLILASRCRSSQDIQTIHSSIQNVFGKKIDLTNLDSPESLSQPIMNELNRIINQSNEIINSCTELRNFVWTPSAKRTALFVSQAYKFNEPFLLVGETGIGKTTICQILSRLNKKNLYIMNCHMHSEASDFLGSIRPVRNASETSNQLFEWQDGPLIDALRQGEDFLIDEISLADDSVLERLNSVLEEEKTLLLAENTNSDRELIRGHVQFRIFATMNPGGDFGKKELSAALRNRFTEIWCPTPTQETNEFEIICNQKLNCSNLKIKNILIKSMITFLRWLKCQDFFNRKTLTGGTISIRDLIKWINFINKFSQSTNDDDANKYYIGLLNGACLVFIDALNNDDLFKINPYNQCITHLIQTIETQVHEELKENLNLKELFEKEFSIFENESTYVRCGPFSITKGNETINLNKLKYSLDSKSTRENLLRILRSLLMDSPIMLEGSPGVGKTSIIEAIGALTCHKVVRINLSEQTDLSELFGADLPVANLYESSEQAQKFNWIDGPFLIALKQGSWIILDEINLASQSVLEGLNSCFDHRGEIYISELNKKFQIDKTQTKIFACQNPYLQGGGRKGLPKSFLNRFSKVYINKMTQDDLLEILTTIFRLEKEILLKMILFNHRLHQEVNVDHLWGTYGAPFEFNLRDLFRWCEIMLKENDLNPGNYVYLIYASRFRLEKDKLKVFEIFFEIFNYEAYKQEEALNIRFTRTHLQIGQSFLQYQTNKLEQFVNKTFAFTNSNVKHLESVIKCLEMNWMVILVGHTCVGKTSLIKMLAKLINQPVVEFSVNSSTDTSDLLGGFAKLEYLKQNIFILIQQLENIFIQIMNNQFLSSRIQLVKNELLFTAYLKFNQEFKNLDNFIDMSLDSLVNLFEKYLQLLSHLIENVTSLSYLSLNLNEIRSNLKSLIHKEKERMKKKITFEWLDSALVKAIEHGEWVLIDNSNFCSPSILDRLNPLLEPNGSIQINEKGLQNGQLVTLRPHKNFRLILCMNEYFGELSRPMRNRGIEIYLNELEHNPDDQQAILKSIYKFDHRLFDFYFSQLNPTISSFAELIKIFRMIYDYSLIRADDTIGNLKQAINEFKLDLDLTKIDSSQSLSHFYNEATKLKEIPLYRYLFNFPLLPNLVSELIHHLTHTTQFKLNTLEDTLTNTVKLMQMVEVWLNNTSLKSMSNILKFTYSILNKNTNKKLKRSIEALQKTVIDSIFVEQNKYYKDYLDILNKMSNKTCLDLLEECLDLESNKFLIQKLQSSNENINSLVNLSKVVKMQLFFYLFKFRLSFLYHPEHDSLISLVKNSDQINIDSNNNVSSFKFILMFYEFCDQFIFDILNALDSKIELNLTQLKTTVYNMEKFYLLISSSFDFHLTISYMKYYWNLINQFLTKNFIWSKNFQSLYELFNHNLEFDDSIFQSYRLIWRLNRPNINLVDSNSLDMCHKFNNVLNCLFRYNSLSRKEFIEKIYHLKLKDNRQITFETCRFTDSTLNQLSSIDYCQIEIFNEDIKKCYTKSSVCHYLNSIYYSNQSKAFQNYIDLIQNVNMISLNQPVRLVSNLSEIMTSWCHFGKFNFLFQQPPNDLLVFYSKFKQFIQNFTTDQNDSFENLIQFVPNEKQINNFEFKSIVHYDWLTQFLSQFFFNSNQLQIQNERVKIELAYYDLKLNEMKTFIKLAWQNHSLIQNVCTTIDQNLIEMLNNQMNSIKNECFSKRDDLLQEHLFKKGLNIELFKEIKIDNQLVQIIKLATHFAYLFSPVEPLDPFEYEQLIEKTHQNELDLQLNETNLNKFNRDFKLKKGQFNDIKSNFKYDSCKQDFYLIRQNKSDYFYLLNEFNNGLNMFCSKHLIRLVNDLNNKNVFNDKLELECINFMSSLEKFIQKLNQFYSFVDVVYLPLNAMSLIGYAFKGMYTQWKTKVNLNQHKETIDLVNLLNQFPLKESHYEIALKLVEYSKQKNDFKLCDDLCLLALMHLVNSLKYSTEIQKTPQIFYDLCLYFNQRYKAYKQYQEDKNKVEEFKYKTFGQKETSTELDDKELNEHFPSFTQYFSDFVRNELDDKHEKENRQTNDEQIQSNQLIDLDVLTKSNDLIEIYMSKQIQDEFYEKNVLQTFYKSYSIGFKLQMINELTLKNCDLTSHLMYSSSINFDFNYNISSSGDILSIYDFYNDSNRSQILKCKTVLNYFSNRLVFLLNEWENNPILIELIKIVQRIELFDLNDPLVKYLTGLELLVEKSQRWQLIESKMTSIEKELKEISSLIVEWRKYELNYWLQSLDLELVSYRKKIAYKWFHHIFSICCEFLNEQVNKDEFLSTLKKFIHLSHNGDYLVRLKQLNICYNIFKDSTNEAAKFLTDALWNIYDFYNVLYTNVINQIVNTEKTSIQKELKDFVDICRWQDMNYWALKQSTHKYNKGLFKIIKKFRSYLNQQIDFNQKFKSIDKQFNSTHLALNIFTSNKQDLELIDKSDSYFNKMVKICKRVLGKKCSKRNFNYHLYNYSNDLVDSFKSLNDASTQIIQQHDKNKNVDKYKKDIKYLMNQKLKFISDLIKKLTYLGLSYRRGNLKLAQEQQDLSQLLYFEPILEQSNQQINEANFAYYICLSRYLDFKQLLDQNNLQVKDSHLIPIEKLKGFVEHLFNIVLNQRKQLNQFFNNLIAFDLLKTNLNKIADCIQLNCFNEADFIQIKNYAKKTFEIMQQLSFFLSSINSLNIPSAELINSDLITNQFNKIKNQLNQLQNLNSNLRYSNEIVDNSSLNNLNENLNELVDISRRDYTPFESIFSKMSFEFKSLNCESLNDNNDFQLSNINLNDLNSQCDKLKLKLLKSVELLFKKYSDGLIEFDSEESLVNELSRNFNDDLQLFSLNDLNQLMKHILTQIESTTKTTSTNELNSIKQILSINSNYLNIFFKFVTQMGLYLNDNHFKTCKTLYVLINIFYELKMNGLALPDELDENGENEEQEDKSSNKFKTDDDDVKGLSSDAQGTKDVSDQIETEDQLDDAKRPEDRENEKEQQDDDNKSVEENENGIEMSDDFESKLQDMENKEKNEDDKNDDEDDENDQSNELDDQKGDVDKAQDRLDEKLWDNDENELDELDNEEGDVQNENNQGKNEEELGAKLEEISDLEDELKDNEINQEENSNQKDESIDQEMKSEIDDQETKEEDAEETNEQDEHATSDQEIDQKEETLNEEKEEENQEDVQDKDDQSKENIENIAEQMSHNNTSQNLHGQNENDLKSNSQIINQEKKDIEKENFEKNLNEIEMSQQNDDLSSNQEANAVEKSQINNAEAKEKKEKTLKQINENRQLAEDDDELNNKNKNAQDIHEDSDRKNENNENQNMTEDMRHIREDEQHFDDKILDAATDNQRLKKSKRNEEDLNDKLQDESLETNKTKKLKNEQEGINSELNKFKDEIKKNDNVIHQDEDKMEQVDSDQVEVKIENQEEKNENKTSLYETSLDNMLMYRSREQVEKKLEKYRQFASIKTDDSVDKESYLLWQDYELLTQQMSKELCEQLKLILEPKICTKLRGDYKSGKRLNMKRVVEYLATEYRKDRIWLRRVKPFKRNYQVMLAIDNSSSMSDNHCIQLAYETIATLANAFNYLEVGQLGLLKFGDKVEPLHELQTNFSSDDGARIISKINFKDERTKIAEMLNFSVDLFMRSESNMQKSTSSSSVNVSKLLFVLSDGRGIFYEGMETVKNSLKDAIQEGIFIVFILLETQATKSSIFDIKMPIFTSGNPIPTIKSYMEQFPFPFYVVLKDVNNLSAIISEALKEWFDMLSRLDS